MSTQGTFAMSVGHANTSSHALLAFIFEIYHIAVSVPSPSQWWNGAFLSPSNLCTWRQIPEAWTPVNLDDFTRLLLAPLSSNSVGWPANSIFSPQLDRWRTHHNIYLVTLFIALGAPLHYCFTLLLLPFLSTSRAILGISTVHSASKKGEEQKISIS